MTATLATLHPPGVFVDQSLGLEFSGRRNGADAIDPAEVLDRLRAIKRNRDQHGVVPSSRQVLAVASNETHREAR